jgi:hypothetical protein
MLWAASPFVQLLQNRIPPDRGRSTGRTGL